MKAPDPLPQPGAWLVMGDGSMYEVTTPDDDESPCTDCGLLLESHDQSDHAPHVPPPLPVADEAGVFYLSVDSGETIWTPWSDVHAVGSYAEVDAIAAAIVREATARLMPPEPVASRFLLTITHAQPVPPPPAFLDALADVIRASMAAAGIPGGARVAVAPSDPDGAWPHGWACPADGAEHWPRQSLAGIEPSTPVECGHCGYVQVWSGTRWEDARS